MTSYQQELQDIFSSPLAHKPQERLLTASRSKKWIRKKACCSYSVVPKYLHLMLHFIRRLKKTRLKQKTLSEPWMACHLPSTRQEPISKKPDAPLPPTLSSISEDNSTC